MKTASRSPSPLLTSPALGCWAQLPTSRSLLTIGKLSGQRWMAKPSGSFMPQICPQCLQGQDVASLLGYYVFPQCRAGITACVPALPRALPGRGSEYYVPWSAPSGLGGEGKPDCIINMLFDFKSHLCSLKNNGIEKTGRRAENSSVIPSLRENSWSCASVFPPGLSVYPHIAIPSPTGALWVTYCRRRRKAIPHLCLPEEHRLWSH